MAETFTLYKLIILYMLKKVDFPLTTSQISEFVLDKGYTSYFKLQEALSELAQSGLIRTETQPDALPSHRKRRGDDPVLQQKDFLSHPQGYRRFSQRKAI